MRIQGVLAFLDRLSGINYTTGSLNAAGDEWQKNLDKAMRELPFLVERVQKARRHDSSQDSEE